MRFHLRWISAIALVLPASLAGFCWYLTHSFGLAFPTSKDGADWLRVPVPFNMYMAQTVSNEPLAACIAAFAVLLCIRLMVRPARCTTLNVMFIGLVLGLALLAKITALFWIPSIEIAVLIAARRNRTGWRKTGSLMMTVLLNEKPDAAHAAATGSPNFLALIHSHVPYDHWLMACGQWLALLPMLLVVIGTLRALVGLSFKPGHACGAFHPPDSPGREAGDQLAKSADSPAIPGLPAGAIKDADLSSMANTNSPIDRVVLSIGILAIAIFMAAIIWQYMLIPLYGWAKASYMLSATPFIAILAAAGFDLLGRTRVRREILGGFIFTWATCAYFTFWVGRYAW